MEFFRIREDFEAKIAPPLEKRKGGEERNFPTRKEIFFFERFLIIGEIYSPCPLIPLALGEI